MLIKRPVKIRDIIRCFEERFPYNEVTNYYLSIRNNKRYSLQEMANVCKGSYYKESDFLVFPKVTAKELKKRYSKQLDDMEMREEFLNIPEEDDYKYDSIFHCLTEDYRIVDDWYEFEKSELTKMAIAWCETNGIKYSLAPEKFKKLKRILLTIKFKIEEIFQKFIFLFKKNEEDIIEEEEM